MIGTRVHTRTLMRYLPLVLCGVYGIAVIGAVLLYFTIGQHHADMPLVVRISTTPIETLPEHEHALGEAESDTGHGVYQNSDIVVVPEDMWVTSVAISTEGAPAAIIHHLILAEPEVPDPFCGLKSGGKKLIVAGRDTDPSIAVPAPYGIFVAKGTKLQLQAMFHNAEPPEGPGGTYHNVTETVTLTGVADGGSRSRKVETRFLALADTSYCDYTPTDFTYTVPAEAEGYVEKPHVLKGVDEGTYTFPHDAYLLLVGAHQHPWDGAQYVRALVNGSEVATYGSKLIDPKVPWSWRSAFSRPILPVKAGDTISIEGVYNNEEPVELRGAMSFLGVFYYEPPTLQNAWDSLLASFKHS